MALMRWRPLEELDQFFENYVKQSTYDLATDILEDEDHIYVEMTTAGMDPQTLTIQVQDNVLRVQGKRPEHYDKRSVHYIRKEIKRGVFERAFTLPSPVENDDHTKAEYENGMLKITLVKEKNKPLSRIKIDIKK